MEERHYAAIAAYDYWLQKTAQPQLLILDLSEIEGALCSVSGAGDVSVREIFSVPGKAEFFSRLGGRLGLGEEEAYALWRDQLRDTNRKLEAHLKNPDRNYPVLEGTGKTLNCADLAGLFEPDRERTMELLRAAEGKLREAGTDPETLRILLSGQMACFAPAVFAVRSFFAPDAPWLADSRFAQLHAGEDPALFAARGEPILREMEDSPFGHDVGVICVFNGPSPDPGGRVLLPIAWKTQRVKSMAEPAYGKTLYLTDRSTLTLSIDRKTVPLSLRDRGIYEGIYRIGMRVADKQPELCFRRTDDPTDEKYIPITI